ALVVHLGLGAASLGRVVGEVDPRLLLDARVGALAERLVALGGDRLVGLHEGPRDGGEGPEQGVAPERILPAADLPGVDRGRASEHLELGRMGRRRDLLGLAGGAVAPAGAGDAGVAARVAAAGL